MFIAIFTQPIMAKLALCCKFSAINDSCCHLAECAVQIYMLDMMENRCDSVNLLYNQLAT